MIVRFYWDTRYFSINLISGHTNTALAGQMLYSLLAVSVNLLLVGGALGRRPPALLSWLVCYVLNIVGCFVLVGVLSATLVHRNQFYGDVQLSEFKFLQT